MGEQVPDAHGLGDRNRRRRQRGAGLVDAGVGERGDEARHRVGQLQRALLVEHHRGDGGDRLGHRVDAPDRVVGHRQPGLEVAQPVVGQVRDAPAPGDRDRPAREQAVVDVAAEVPVDPREPGGVEPDLPGLGVDLDQGHGPTLLARGVTSSSARRPRTARRGAPAASRGRHQPAGRVDDHECPVAGVRVTDVRGVQRDRRTARDSDPASTVSPVTPSTHQPRSSRAGQRGGVDDDRRRAGMPDQQQPPGHGGDVEDRVDDRDPERQPGPEPAGDRDGRTARPSATERTAPRAGAVLVAPALSYSFRRNSWRLNGPVRGSTRQGPSGSRPHRTRSGGPLDQPGDAPAICVPNSSTRSNKDLAQGDNDHVLSHRAHRSAACSWFPSPRTAGSPSS